MKMFQIELTEQFDKNFSKIKDAGIRQQIYKKVCQLKDMAPLGKKLKGNPFWSVHIGRFRVIYVMRSTNITVIDVLERKKEYKELR